MRDHVVGPAGIGIATRSGAFSGEEYHACVCQTCKIIAAYNHGNLGPTRTTNRVVIAAVDVLDERSPHRSCRSFLTQSPLSRRHLLLTSGVRMGFCGDFRLSTRRRLFESARIESKRRDKFDSGRIVIHLAVSGLLSGRVQLLRFRCE